MVLIMLKFNVQIDTNESARLDPKETSVETCRNKKCPRDLERSWLTKSIKQLIDHGKGPEMSGGFGKRNVAPLSLNCIAREGGMPWAILFTRYRSSLFPA